jgi:hypothetical protein
VGLLGLGLGVGLLRGSVVISLSSIP